MRHDRICTTGPVEPCFEAPPQLPPTVERRLTRQAAALFDQGGDNAYRDNSISLMVAGDGSAQVRAVGPAVAGTFGLRPGPLAGPPEALAAVLAAALDRLDGIGTVTGFEAAVATPAAACVLLRGVLLPVAGGAEAVLSWKQVLDADATARLRAELLLALATPPRAPPIDAFA